MPRIDTKKKAAIAKQTVEEKEALERKKTAASRRQGFTSSAQIHQGVGIGSIEIEAEALSSEIFESRFIPSTRKKS
jgi:hypothetical protein